MVKLRANAADPEVMTETGEIIVVSGYLGHISCKSKTLVFVLRSRGNRYIKWRMICVFIEPRLDVFAIER